MRYMTPDTPGTRSLESPVARRTEKGEEDKATMAMATALPSKREVTTPSATPTPTPSPTKAAESVETRKPARRAIRTYGKKRPLVEDTSKGNIVSQPVKRQKTTATQETTAQTAQVEMARPSTPKAHDFDVDEISRQLLKEAEEAERRNRKNRENKERPQTPRKPSPQKPSQLLRRAGGSPRKQGIMRYFQPAEPRSVAAVQAPPLLQQSLTLSLPEPPSSPAASVSSMSSLSSCPSPNLSTGSFFSRASSLEPSSPAEASLFASDDTATDGPQDTSSPPPSPFWAPSEQRPRQKRRLTIRPDGHLSTTTADETMSEMRRDAIAMETREREAKSSAPTMTISSMMAASSSRMRLQLGLSKTASTTTTPTPTTLATKKRKKTVGVPSVQTTLSLAIAGGGDSASVKECKECNILYNPLHEKDAKFHARYHASVCRKQQI